MAVVCAWNVALDRVRVIVWSESFEPRISLRRIHKEVKRGGSGQDIQSILSRRWRSC